jgi:hypothetical protein
MEHDEREPRAKPLVVFGVCLALGNRLDHRGGRPHRGVTTRARRHARLAARVGAAPGTGRRLGESLVVAWIVAGGSSRSSTPPTR